MKNLRLLKGLATSLACWGMLVPQAVMASGPDVETTAPAVVDVALHAHGTLSGQVLDEQGLGLEGAVVSIRQGRDELVQTVAGKDGQFSVVNLKGGVYQVAAGQSNGLYRFWAAKTAPPSAKSNLRIVSQSSVVRGQEYCGDYACDGGTDWVGVLTLGVSVGALIVSSIALSDINDVEDKLDDAIADDLVGNLPATP